MLFFGRKESVPNLRKPRCLGHGSPRALGVEFYELGICQQATKRQKAEMLVCYMPLDNSASAALAFGASVRCNQL